MLYENIKKELHDTYARVFFCKREVTWERNWRKVISNTFCLQLYRWIGCFVFFSPFLQVSFFFSLFRKELFFFILLRSKYKSYNFLEFLGMFFINFRAVYKLFGAVSPLSLAHFLAVASACYSEHFVSFSYVASRLSRPPHSLASLKPGPVSVWGGRVLIPWKSGKGNGGEWSFRGNSRIPENLISASMSSACSCQNRQRKEWIKKGGKV